MPRYRFEDFVISPRRRILTRRGVEQPLIPRYFDLLIYLVERRGDAVHRREIFDRVWSDVIVSDSALSQAIRTIRRVLGDEPREPRFVRTVSRHGYQFIFPAVVEEEDDGELSGARGMGAAADAPPEPPSDPFEPLLARLAQPATTSAEEEDQREAAELLHALGTPEALRRIETHPARAHVRALLRDTRWDVPNAGDVPILGTPDAWQTARHLVTLRLRRAAAVSAGRWRRAALGAGAAGAIGGAGGGLLLSIVPEAIASPAVIPVLALVGAVCGSVGGAGVGAGLSLAETALRSHRAPARIAGAAAGGGIVGLLVQWLTGSALLTLVGMDATVGGGLEGVVIGGAAGLGYSLSAGAPHEGLAAPRGRRRYTVAAATACACGLAALALSLAGRPLVGGTVHLVAGSFSNAQASLAPLASLIGEPDFGRVTGALIATGEGLLFGSGLAIGLTRRVSPAPPSTTPTR